MIEHSRWSKLKSELSDLQGNTNKPKELIISLEVLIQYSALNNTFAVNNSRE